MHLSYLLYPEVCTLILEENISVMYTHILWKVYQMQHGLKCFFEYKAFYLMRYRIIFFIKFCLQNILILLIPQYNWRKFDRTW